MRIQGRWLVNLSLLLIVLVLGGLVVLHPRKQEAVKLPLLNVDLAGVSQITLANGEQIEFERKDGVWRLTQPFIATVNQVRVEQLLAITRIIPAAEYPLPEQATLKSYGLSEPFATLGLAGAELKFGGTAPLDRRRYVQSGQRLYMVDDSFAHQLVSKATDFVDKKLIPEEATIRALKLPGLSLSKSAEGNWSSAPLLQPEQIQEMIMQWATSRAIEVRHGAPKVLGEKIELETSMGRIKFSILQKQPELVLGREDLNLVFVMTAETTKALLNPTASKPSLKADVQPKGSDRESEESDPSHQDTHSDE